MRINNSLDKEFKVFAIRMLTEFWTRIEENSENFNKNLKKEPVRNEE